jgi:hypothetical protein
MRHRISVQSTESERPKALFRLAGTAIWPYIDGINHRLVTASTSDIVR